MSLHLLSVSSAYMAFLPAPKIFREGWTFVFWISSVMTSCLWFLSLEKCLANRLSHFQIPRNTERSSDDLSRMNCVSYHWQLLTNLTVFWSFSSLSSLQPDGSIITCKWDIFLRREDSKNSKNIPRMFGMNECHEPIWSDCDRYEL